MNLKGASRLSGLLTSVVDLHVRMALQEEIGRAHV